MENIVSYYLIELLDLYSLFSLKIGRRNQGLILLSGYRRKDKFPNISVTDVYKTKRRLGFPRSVIGIFRKEYLTKQN